MKRANKEARFAKRHAEHTRPLSHFLGRSCRIALFALGAISMIYAAIAAKIDNFNSGVVFAAIFGLVLIALAIFSKQILKLRWLAIVIASCFAAFALFVTSVALYAEFDNCNYREDAAIVLGVNIKGDKITPQLAKRLDRAVEYSKKNPKAVILVSGGQGPYEKVSEACVMEKYLVEKGVPANNIIKEENSNSTYTNFVNSKRILDDLFEDDYTVTVITSSYHIYRATALAKKAGLDCTRLHADTPLYIAPVRYFRECAGIVHMWLFGK